MPAQSVQIYPGQRFETLDKFRETIRIFAVETNFAAPRFESNKTRVIVRCGRGRTEDGTFTCRFRVTAAISIRHKVVIVAKTANITHSCQHAPEVTSRTVYNNQQWLTGAILRDVPPLTKQTTTSTIKSVISHHERVNKSKINNKAVQRVRATLLGDTKLEEIRSYHQIPDYIRRIQASNPIAYTNTENNEITGQFSRLFICPPTSRPSFQHCRRIVAVDGTFGKGRFQQTILFACTIDGNDHIVPLAWAVVDKETDSNWAYFFAHLTIAIPEFNSPETTLISDRAKGIASAAETHLPRVKRAACCQHLAANVQKDYGVEARKLFWACAKARNPVDFNMAMDILFEKNPRAAQYIGGFGNNLWVSHQMEGRHYGLRTSNIVESLNNTFLVERELPIVEMLDHIWHRVMDGRFRRRVEAEKWIEEGRQFTKSAQQALDESQHYSTRNSTVYISTVTDGRVTEDHPHLDRRGQLQRRVRRVVLYENTRSGSCSCGRFQENGIPCGHAVAFMQQAGVAPVFYMPEIRSVASYMDTYRDPTPMQPIDSSNLLEHPNCAPPQLTRTGGRPKKQRIRAGGARVRVQHCTDCGQTGHNSRSCSNPPLLDIRVDFGDRWVMDLDL